jgi:cell division protein ZapE
LPRYQALVDAGALAPDPAQAEAAMRLHSLSRNLAGAVRPPLSFLMRTEPPKGVYLWGPVGGGKTLLMDVFFNNAPARLKRRAHFHEFMADAHDRIARWRSSDSDARVVFANRVRAHPDDPIALTAAEFAAAAQLLCLDEFQVNDIADAMILGRLFASLLARGVIMVATSNRHPDELYKDGVNRHAFLPFISMLKERLDLVRIDSGRDYRLDRMGGMRTYHAPLGKDADAAMDRAWSGMIAGAQERSETIAVKGRTITVPRVARGLARFTFSELCEAPFGAADYLAVARRYSALFIDRIPQMSPERRNEARRFLILIDAIYDNRTKLVCSAAALPGALYSAGDGAEDFARTVSRLIEMQSAEYIGSEHGAASPARASVTV